MVKKKVNSFQAVKLMLNKIVCILNVDLAFFYYVHTSYKQDEVEYNSDLIFLNLGENKVSF